MEEVLIGMVSHYFAQPQVGAVKLEAELRVGDVLHFRGRTTEFEQTVDSMQIEHEPVETADPGSEVGLQVLDRVREGDQVFKVTA
jgi:putative protease